MGKFMSTTDFLDHARRGESVGVSRDQTYDQLKLNGWEIQGDPNAGVLPGQVKTGTTPITSAPIETRVPGAMGFERQQAFEKEHPILGAVGQPLGVLANVPASTVSAIGRAGSMVAHPKETLKGVGQLLSGAFQAATGLGQTQYNPDGTITTVEKTPEKQVFDDFIDYWKERYGGGSPTEIMQNISKTLYEDPIGAFLDFSVAKAGVKGLKKGAKRIAGASEELPPFTPAVTPKKGLLQKQSEKLISEYIRPGAKEYKFGKNPEAAVVRNGIYGATAESFHQNLIKTMNEKGAAIEPTVEAASKASPVVENLAPLIESPLDDALKNAIGAERGKIANPELFRALHEIKARYVYEMAPDEVGRLVPKTTKAGKLIPKNHTGNQSLNLAIKRAIQEDINWTGNASLDEPLNAVKWKIFENLKENLNKNVPGIAELNNDFSELHAANVAMTRRLPQIQRAAKFPLGSMLRAGFIGKMYSLPAALGEFAMEKVLTSALGKTMGAQVLHKTAKILPSLTAPVQSIGGKTLKISRILPSSK